MHPGPGTFGPILKVNTSGVILNQYQTPQSASCVLSLTNGPDAALWGTEAVLSGDQIVRITTSGVISQFAVPEGGGAIDPSLIVTGSDGNLWFTGTPFFRIGTVTTSGGFNDRLLPGISFNGTSYVGPTMDNPFGITSGPDGAIWFTEEGSSVGVGAAPSKIARITTGGTITEFLTPTAFSTPFTITTGPDGALWFTESAVNKLGRITTGGAITEFPITSGAAVPTSIVTGPDGGLWFTQGTFSQSSGSIGHAVLSAVSPPGTPAPSSVWLTLVGIVALGAFAVARKAHSRASQKHFSRGRLS
jgi:virginiamycin B lyase